MKTRITSTIISTVACLGVLYATLAGIQTVHAGDPGPPCTIFVTSTADSGPGSLRDAVEICAGPGQTITFDTNGVFATPQTIVLTNGEIVIDKNLTILGPGADRVAISGNYPNTTNRVLHITPSNVVTIVGLTITNGNVGSIIDGGGILNERATLTLSNCTVTGNSAAAAGGILNDGFDGSATLTIVNSTISDNRTTSGIGGGIWNDGAFSGSSATLTLVNSTVRGNHAVDDGGGIFNDGRDSGHATVTVLNSTFSGNKVDDDGGGIANIGTGGSATLTVSNSTFSSNTATNGIGGGIINDGSGGTGTVVIVNSTVSGNAAYDAGGIESVGRFSGNATLLVANSTFSGNSGNPVSSIYINSFDGSSTLEIGSTILNAGNGTNIFSDSGTVTSDGYNLSSDGGVIGIDTTGSLNATGDQTNTPPLLGPLADNGGPTLTHALRTGSPAIDGGKNFSASLTDQRGTGFARTVDLAAPNTTGSDGTDIGAFEAVKCNTLDPLAFTSLGASPFTSNGTYTIDTSASPPVMTKADSSTINGVVSNGIAVFTFSDITIGAGVTVTGLKNAASRPLALLSRGSVTIAGIVDVSGDNGQDIPGGIGGNAGPGGGGGGGGSRFSLPGSGGVGFVNGSNGGTITGGNGGSVVAGGGGSCGPNDTDGGGGAFGGNGGNGFIRGNGGTAYGDLASILQGGSGGAGGGGIDGGTGGGGGGGVVEIGASGNITVSGVVRARGGNGDDSTILDGGGGAGGGILLHACAVTFSGAGSISANGGNAKTGGSGGGGRVLILTLDGTITGDLASQVQVLGGTTSLGGGVGSPGVKEVGTQCSSSCLANQPPTASCSNITVSAGVSCNANASIDAGSTDLDAGDMITLEQSPVGPYSLGTTPVTLTVTDSHNAQDSCMATVTVVDVTLPTVTCTSNRIVNATSPTGAVVTFPLPTASDNCSVASRFCSPSSGSTFASGTSTVTCYAVDGSANTNSCAFTVKIKSASEQISDLITLVNGLSGVKNATKNALIVKLNAAQKALKQGNTALACSNLKDFISLALAQMGKKEITAAQANLLIAQATNIRVVLACP